ncbi:MAG: alpha/beta hydrolase [Chitinophagales bacterium]
MKKWFLFLFISMISTAVFAQRNIGAGVSLNNNNNGQSEAVSGYVGVNGINMYYETYGSNENPPLLMIHGNGGSTESFSKQIRAFSKKYFVILADSRAQGKTNNTADTLSYEMMTSDYNLLLEQLDIDSVYLIGHSDGGIIGLMLAMYHPEKVKRMVIIGANLWPDTSAVSPKGIGWAHDEYARLQDSVRAGKKQYANELLLTRLLLNAPHIDPEDLQNIQIPVLVMCGDHDIIQLQHTIYIYEHLPMAQLSIIPGSSHFIPQTQPAIFNNVAARFLIRPFENPDMFYGMDGVGGEEDN